MSNNSNITAVAPERGRVICGSCGESSDEISADSIYSSEGQQLRGSDALTKFEVDLSLPICLMQTFSDHCGLSFSGWSELNPLLAMKR